MGRQLKRGRPDFAHPSWNHSLMGATALVDPGWWSGSYQALQTRVTTAFDKAASAYGKLGKHPKPPMKTKVRQWADTLDGYIRPIAYQEAAAVAQALEALAQEIGAQAAKDETAPKPAAVPKTPAAPAHGASAKGGARASGKEEEEDEGDADVSAAQMAAALGHSVATARSRPPEVKAKPPRKLTAEQQKAEDWRHKQRQMAGQCDSTIRFGAHEVTQDSVLDRLGPGPHGRVWQGRDTPANTHRRIMWSDQGDLWTDGLSHRERRDRGEYSVYLRDGAKNRFTHVSGHKLKEDPT
ncbi:hypothetical protein DXV76_11550 [Rhodobacteraceae bacterium CCMM004]|nr:hypothetical protein DXV76_11550 [Rhodobacteraceae bacterium CCMM004]